MDKILHDPKDLKLWELWYIPYYGSCRILSINRMDLGSADSRKARKIRGSRPMIVEQLLKGSGGFVSWVTSTSECLEFTFFLLYT